MIRSFHNERQSPEGKKRAKAIYAAKSNVITSVQIMGTSPASRQNTLSDAASFDSTRKLKSSVSKSPESRLDGSLYKTADNSNHRKTGSIYFEKPKRKYQRQQIPKQQYSSNQTTNLFIVTSK